jgi:hypothetical protein
VAELGVLRVRAADQSDLHVAREIADLRHLDLQDLGAEIGEVHRRVRALNLLSDLYDADSVQRSGHVKTSESAVDDRRAS